MAVQGIRPLNPPVAEAREVPPSTGAPRPPSVPPPPVADPEAAAAQPSSEAPAQTLHAAPSPAAMGLRFQVDAETGKTIVSVVDQASGEVIRQMPSEEALAVAKALGKFEGAFVDLKV